MTVLREHTSETLVYVVNLSSSTSGPLLPVNLSSSTTARGNPKKNPKEKGQTRGRRRRSDGDGVREWDLHRRVYDASVQNLKGVSHDDSWALLSEQLSIRGASLKDSMDFNRE